MTAPKRRWFRFSLRTLFVATLGASIGMAMQVSLFKNYLALAAAARMLIWMASGALIGGALLMPFKRSFWGALGGLIVQLVLLKEVSAVRDLFPPESLP